MPEVEVEKTEEQKVDFEVALRQKLEEEYATRLQSEIQSISAKMQEENKRIVTEAVERMRKELTPPGPEDIQKLVSQEYQEYTIDVKYSSKTGGGLLEKHFVIRELPYAVEKKMYDKIKNMVVPMASDVASLTMHMLEGDAATKIVKIMHTFDPALEVMVSVCTLCLNPFGEEADVNEEWVRRNMSSARIVKVITAQIECNRMRDFFSLLFQGSKLLK